MKTNNKIYTTLAIFALLSLFLIVFFVWPLIKQIKTDSENLVSDKNSMLALSAQIKEIENFKKNYESYKPELEKIDQLFVDSNNPVEFIEFLEETAYDSSITSQISLPSSSSNSQQFIILQFSSKGSFSGILNFAKKIETGPYLVEIENLTIQRPSLDIKDAKANNATFAIKVFTKK